MTSVKHWVRPSIRQLQAYAVHSAGQMIKLDAMENPHRWPQPMCEAWLKKMADVSLNRYPDAGAEPLKAVLRRYMGFAADAPLVLGNGSDELIQLLMLLVGGPGRCVLAAEPTFVMYRMIAVYTDTEYVSVDLDDTFGLDVAAMCEAIERHQPAIVFLATPNNPTGNQFDASALRKIVDCAPGLVVIDEAYAPFTSQPSSDGLVGHPQVIVMRTLSKLGLAGLRLGLVTGPADWMAELEKIRLPYNINALSQASAEFALDYKTVISDQAAAIVRDRSVLATGLDALDGVEVYPSDANFLMFRVPPGSAGRIHEGLKVRGILIKKLDGAQPRLADCLRVTVGTAEENATFLTAIGAELSLGN